MKKLLVILISVVGFNAYAGISLKLKNNSTEELAVECFPSKFFCNGIVLALGSCTCGNGDTVMYFGRVGMPHDESWLDWHVTWEGYAGSNTNSGYNFLGDGNVWRIFPDQHPANLGTETCTLNGDPSATVFCIFTEN